MAVKHMVNRHHHGHAHQPEHTKADGVTAYRHRDTMFNGDIEMSIGLRAFLILEGIIIAFLLLYLAAGAYVQ
jgi:hypothetical protein